MIPSACFGRSQKGATLKAKTLSNRSFPKSAFSSAAVLRTALPPAMCSRFLRVAISIIFCERSIAVIRPLVSRSQTSDTATPCPQPTSSTRSAGSSARVSTAHTNRSEGLLAMPRVGFGCWTGWAGWTDSGMQAGPVDELLDVAVERPALDQLEVEVGRTLKDRVISGLTGDDREERHLQAVDQTGDHQRPVHRQAAVRAQRHLGLLLEPGDDVDGVIAHDGRVRPVEGAFQSGRHDRCRHAPHPRDPWVTHLGLLGARGQHPRKCPIGVGPEHHPVVGVSAPTSRFKNYSRAAVSLGRWVPDGEACPRPRGSRQATPNAVRQKTEPSNGPGSCTSCQPALRAASSIEASMLSKSLLSIVSITGPVSRPMRPPQWSARFGKSANTSQTESRDAATCRLTVRCRSAMMIAPGAQISA